MEAVTIFASELVSTGVQQLMLRGT